MTACKDSLNGKKAVSATLAGVLAVGMVPAAAFAETAQADTTTGDEGVSLQVAPEQDAFNRGTIAPSGLSQTNGAYSVNANADGTPLTIGASTVIPLGASDAITVDGKNYTTAIYAADADGNATGEALKNVYKLTCVKISDTEARGITRPWEAPLRPAWSVRRTIPWPAPAPGSRWWSGAFFGCSPPR